MKIKIPRVEEPTQAKKQWEKELKINFELALAAIKQGTWFTKPYWNSYKNELKAQGVTWQDLMKAYRLTQHKFLAWIMGKEEWENVINHLEEQLNAILDIKKKLQGSI